MVRLQHGTTRKRAEAILANRPDPKFVEPGGLDTADGFSTAPAEGPFPEGSPIEYAMLKARLFPDEGGPAIVELEVSEALVQMTWPEIGVRDLLSGGDIRFQARSGLEELLEA